MAHQVTKKDSGWMFRVPAWHRLFKVGEKRPKNIKEARKMSGLEWDVETVPFITMPQLKKLVDESKRGALSAKQLLALAGEWTAPNHRAIVRFDTLDVLGVWSDEGVPITNEQGFAFMEAVLGETVFEALFSIRGGQQVCLLSEFPDHITIAGDQVRRFLYTRLDHSGQGSTQVMDTNVRVQCANTDRMALTEAGGRDGIYRLRHIGDVSNQIAEVRKMFGLSIDYAKLQKKLGDKLGRVKLRDAKLEKILADVYPASSETDRSVKNAEERRELVMAIFRGDTSHPKVEHDTRGNAPGTKWCAYNAVVEYEQHFRRVMVPRADPDRDRKRAERQFIRATDDHATSQKALDLIAAA